MKAGRVLPRSGQAWSKSARTWPTPVQVAPLPRGPARKVYRATVKGKTVAVKVQRPDVREQATLDLYLMRNAAKLGEMMPIGPLAEQCKQMNEMFDTTAPTFLMEMDYEAEAANQRRFAETVAGCDLIKDTIIVPEVLFCTREVLIQEWLDGTKLTEPEFDQESEMSGGLETR